MKGIRKLAPYLRPYYKTIAVMVILGVFSSLADSIYPLFTSYALDTFVAGKTLRGIVPFSLLYLLKWTGTFGTLRSIICRRFHSRISTRTMSAISMPGS